MKNNKVTKKDIKNLLNKRTWISSSLSYNNDETIKIDIVLGEEMQKTDNISLILKELKTINTRLDCIDTRLDNLEKDVSSLKAEAKKHGWDIK